MIEKEIADRWCQLCGETLCKGINPPGRRTIYDTACKLDNITVGFDVRTKDLDAGRYSDGGVCAVDNLLRFLVNEKGVFVIIEVGHSDSGGHRSVEYVEVVPLHLLPKETYRIENLGTGQVRLNVPMKGVEVDWSRSLPDFLNIFTDVVIAHYEHVSEVATKRAIIIQEFRESKYVSRWNGMRT